MPQVDWKEFENWLSRQTQETCVKIATRAALRVFPFITHIESDDGRVNKLALLAARAILTSGVAGTMPTPDVRAFAAATRDATRAATRAAAATATAAFAAAAARAATRTATRAAAATVAAADAAAAGTRATTAAAAAFAPAATRAAAYADTEIDPAELFQTPIWHETREPDWLVSVLITLPNLLERDPEWSFWREWYQGYLDGKPLDWELQKEIALIPRADWKKGPEHIAQVIEEIRKKYDRKPLDQEQVTEQAERLIAQPETTALVTSAVADQIDEATEQYFSETKVNQLPDALQPLHLLPPLLRRVAASSQSNRIAELEMQINELVATVGALNDALEKAKGRSRRYLAVDTAITATVKIATAAFWGTVAAGVSHVTGIIDVGNLLERLSSAVSELPHVLEVPAPPPVPPIDG